MKILKTLILSAMCVASISCGAPNLEGIKEAVDGAGEVVADIGEQTELAFTRVLDGTANAGAALGMDKETCQESGFTWAEYTDVQGNERGLCAALSPEKMCKNYGHNWDESTKTCDKAPRNAQQCEASGYSWDEELGCDMLLREEIARELCVELGHTWDDALTLCKPEEE